MGIKGIDHNGADCFACLRPEDVYTGLHATDKYQAIRMAGELLVKRGCVTSEYVDAMLEREDLVTTYIGDGVSIPHGVGAAKDMILSTGLVVLQFPDGVPFGDEKAYLVVGIASLGKEHLPILSTLANLMLDEPLLKQMKHVGDASFLYKQLTGGGEQS